MIEEPMDAKELGKWLREWKAGSWTGIHHRSIEGQMMLALLALLERADRSLVTAVAALRHAEWLKISTEARGEINKVFADLGTVLVREGGG